MFHNQSLRILIFFCSGINVNEYRKSGIKITTDIGLIVEYDGVFNVFVKVSNSYKEKLSGLCGNFNGDRRDEFQTPEKKLVKNAISFGNSWKTDNSCPNVTILDEHPCKTGSARARKAKQQCSALKKPPFSICNTALDPDIAHIEDCEYDFCACEDNPNACLCQSLAGYEEVCYDLGVRVQWKHLKEFKKCGKCSNN